MQPNKITIVILSLVSLALIAFLGVKTRNLMQEYNYIGRDSRDTITVNGQGKVTTEPDLTIITLGVVTEGATVEDIQTQNTNKMNSIITAIKELGIADKDIQTQNFNVNPKYTWDDGDRKEDGYQINQNVEVKVRDKANVSKILSRSAELGANQIGGMRFVIDDNTQFEQEARKKAIADAQSKANELANSLGMTIVKVVTFSEYNSPSPAPYYARDMMATGMAEAAVPEPMIEQGSEEVISNVSVTFEVR